MQVLGIDVGGTGIKGAIIDTSTGELVTERFRIDTPQPATPAAVAQTVKAIVEQFNWQGLVGIGFPAAIVDGICKTAGNIDKDFIDIHLNQYFSDTTGCECHCANDADVAGLAEVTFGQGKDKSGLIAMITLGTGIGTALFNQGVLIPNFEMGQIRLDNGKIGEKYAADSIRKNEELGWNKWGKRLNIYLNDFYALCYPSQIILGGGASKKIHKYQEQLQLPCPIVAATLLNHAGCVGAALFALGQKK